MRRCSIAKKDTEMPIAKPPASSRTGLALLVAMNDAQLTKAMANVGVVKAECQPQRVS